jgi:hypothetical protein
MIEATTVRSPDQQLSTGVAEPEPLLQPVTETPRERGSAATASYSETPESAGTAAIASAEPRIILLPGPVALTESRRLLQLWEGLVQAVTGEVFIATLRDKTNPTYPEEEMSIALDEVPVDDRALVVPGAVFYWSIGYKEGPGQPREGFSRIRFRRLPGWSARELSDARGRARELIASLRGS